MMSEHYRRYLNIALVTAGLAVTALVSGCGGGSGSTSAAGSSAAPGSTTTTSPAATLYADNCAGCHGALDVSSKKGITLARLQTAIANNTGGMGSLSTLTAAEQQAIVNALTPVTPPPVTGTDGAALYAADCAGCHGALASSTKKGITLVRLQNAINGNFGGMGTLSTLTTAQQQAIVDALAPAAPPPPPTTVDGPALYASNCAGCHGALATSSKIGMTLARLQSAIAGNVGGMGSLSTLTTAQQQAIVTALTPATPPPPPTTVNGPTLYASNCAGCHGPLASSGKAGATATRIQTAITNNIGGMGSLSTLSAAQVSAIATALAGVTTTPPPTPACGSCHAIPPATGQHQFHSSRATCATCHGSGYSTTTVNAATHNNGTKNLTTTIGWNATSRSCSNSCHGRKSW